MKWILPLGALCGVALGLLAPVPRPFDPVEIASLKAENEALRQEVLSKAGEEDVMAKLAIMCFKMRAKS